jgi:hypothetical protein
MRTEKKRIEWNGDDDGIRIRRAREWNSVGKIETEPKSGA